MKTEAALDRAVELSTRIEAMKAKRILTKQMLEAKQEVIDKQTSIAQDQQQNIEAKYRINQLEKVVVSLNAEVENQAKDDVKSREHFQQMQAQIDQ